MAATHVVVEVLGPTAPPELAAAIARRLHDAWYAAQGRALDDTLQDVRRYASGAAGRMLVARDADRRFVGCVALRRSPGGRRLFAGDLYVEPSARRLGVAKLLSGHALAHAARELGATELYAHAAPDAPAWLTAFYESMGFLRVASDDAMHTYVVALSPA